MPTFSELDRFRRDFQALSSAQRKLFIKAIKLFVQGLQENRLDPRLRVKRVKGKGGVWEISWAPDGRATFHYGDPQAGGTAYVVWRRVGSHAILKRP